MMLLDEADLAEMRRCPFIVMETEEGEDDAPSIAEYLAHLVYLARIGVITGPPTDDVMSRRRFSCRVELTFAGVRALEIADAAQTA
jgi:hypothetical protein